MKEDRSDAGDHVSSDHPVSILIEKDEVSRGMSRRVDGGDAAPAPIVRRVVLDTLIDVHGSGKELCGGDVGRDRWPGLSSFELTRQVHRAHDVVVMVMGENDLGDPLAHLHAHANVLE